MSVRASARRGMIKTVVRGSKWTNGSTVVQVYDLEVFGEYAYVIYHDESTPEASYHRRIDALAFVNMFSLHTKVELPKQRKIEPVYNEATGKYRNVGWC